MTDVGSDMVLKYYDRWKSLEVVIKRKSGIEMIAKSKNRRKNWLDCVFEGKKEEFNIISTLALFIK